MQARAGPVAQLELAPPVHAKFEPCICVPAVRAGDTVWQCEFCDFVNRVDLVPEELAEICKSAMVDFLVQATEQQPQAALKVFAIDVSGSMCVTTEVEGKMQLLGAAKRDQVNRDLLATQGEGGAQWLPHQRQNVTHVSRLQCVQGARPSCHRWCRVALADSPRQRRSLRKLNIWPRRRRTRASASSRSAMR